MVAWMRSLPSVIPTALSLSKRSADVARRRLRSACNRTLRSVVVVSTLWVWCASASAREPSLEELTIATSAGTIHVPRQYATNHVARTSTASSPTTTLAFQFQMPDGRPVTHDYGGEGLPEISEDEQSYPVVVHSIRFGNLQDQSRNPSRLMMNSLAISGEESPTVHRERGLLSFRQQGEGSLDVYFVPTIDPKSVNEVTAFVTCFKEQPPPMPSACAGWVRSVQDDFTGYIRFPRRKVFSLPSIIETEIRLIQGWRN